MVVVPVDKLNQTKQLFINLSKE